MNHFMNNIRKHSTRPLTPKHSFLAASAPPIQPTLDALFLTPDSAVVALGAEAGRFTLPIARYFATKTGTGKIYVCDFSAEAVNRFYQKAKDAHLENYVRPYHIRSVKPYSIPVANDQVDAVLAINTVQFQAAPELYLKECHRILRPGGTVLVAHRPEARVSSNIEKSRFELTQEDVWGALKRSGAEICTSIDIPGYKWTILVVKPLIHLPV